MYKERFKYKMNLENIKFKYIKEDEFLCYLDWLTRFKNPINNLLRVSEKIISKNITEPHFNIKKISELTFIQKIKYAQYVWNKSLKKLLPDEGLSDEKLKNFLIYEEEMTYNTDYLIEELKRLEYEFDTDKLAYKDLRGKLFFDIDNLVNYFQKKEKKPFFLQRLIQKKNSQLTNEALFNKISDFASVKLLFLVEGITEEKLFPLFAKIYNFDLEQNGVKLKSAGGKTHLLKYYADNRNLFKIPIFILLDADGKDIINSLNSIINPKDTVYLINKGEIEDILPHKLIIKSINSYYAMEGSISEGDLLEDIAMTKILYNLYKEKGFGEFHKAKFAQILQENISEKEDLSEEIEVILNKLKLKNQQFLLQG